MVGQSSSDEELTGELQAEPNEEGPLPPTNGKGRERSGAAAAAKSKDKKTAGRKLLARSREERSSERDVILE